ncbi:MAG TPA: hypothetical protein VLJ60_03615, partial [bacterium]|nr:hypothetical protein [bacterium]
RAEKAGVFKIGPASVKLQSGKTANSNIVSVTVTGSLTSSPSSQGNDSVDSSVPTTNSLLAPLTNWEKKTPNYFLRAVVNPAVEVYEGEPLVVKYYLFTKPGMISDISSYKSPSFENCWKEEKVESRFKAERGAIEGTVYDYGLLATYILIPQKGADSVTATQMILDVTIGSFFNTRKQSLSTPALKIPLVPLPEKELHKDGLFADISVTADKGSITLDKDNLLETVTFTINGCGNLQSAVVELLPVSELKYFAPEVELNADGTAKGYCGQKKYKFMVKGLKKGRAVINAKDIETFSRENGWQVLKMPEITVNVKDVSISADPVAENVNHSFELLKELPDGIKKYENTPLIKRNWFRVLLAIPFMMVMISALLWFLGNFRESRSKSRRAKVEKWKERLNIANSLNELLNIFYDALKEIYSIELRGERKHNVKKKYGDSIGDILAFIKDIEFASYSSNADSDISAFKSKAIGFLDIRGVKK